MNKVRIEKRKHEEPDAQAGRQSASRKESERAYLEKSYSPFCILP